MMAADDSEARKIEIESKLHHLKSENACKTLADDAEKSKNNPSVVTICVDLQQVLFAPRLIHCVLSEAVFLLQSRHSQSGK